MERLPTPIIRATSATESPDSMARTACRRRSSRALADPNGLLILHYTGVFSKKASLAAQLSVVLPRNATPFANGPACAATLVLAEGKKSQSRGWAASVRRLGDDFI